MQLLDVIRAAFATRGPLDPKNLSERVRDVAVGVMEDADIPACLALYRVNERAYFPAGVSAAYEAQLRNRHFVNLVARRDGAPVGCGGLMYDANGDAWLCFGMVDPAHQRQGIGTALFLARLALLTPAGGWATVRLTAVPNSVAFYRRFGFLFTHTIRTGMGYTHPLGTLHVRASEIDACRAILADRRITYPDVSDVVSGVSTPGGCASGAAPD